MLGVGLVSSLSLLYIALLFMIAFYADRKQEQGQSIISNPHIYSLSIAVYTTTWTYYGSVGRAATTGLDFLLIYLGPSLTAFSWWFLLRRIVRISKRNNVTSIADFISARYGKSQLLGALITVIAMAGIMPYMALQLKAVSSTFSIITGHTDFSLPLTGGFAISARPGFWVAAILCIFSIIFGARHLISSERHEGLVAAVAVESIAKLFALLILGAWVTYYMYDGFGDIFGRFMQVSPEHFRKITTIGANDSTSPATSWFTTLFLSMGAVMLLPRQFQILVIENSNEEHIKEAMWLFPAYMFLINLFVLPIAVGGILTTGSTDNADFFVLTLPLQSGHYWLSLLVFIGGFSAAAGMVMVESVAISTMFLNHLVMPVVVKLHPRGWFPLLLINIKRLGIFLVIFLGYLYYHIVGETYMLVNLGLLSFAAVAQFAPALLGGLYWRRGNKPGAIAGISLGFILWFYTLMVPSFIESGWWKTTLLTEGPFGIALLKPTELFGLTGFDIWTNAMFWSMLFNVGSYLACSLLLSQSDTEAEQAAKFVDVFVEPREEPSWEAKRFSKPVTIMQFVNLMAKFIGEAQAHAAITEYLGNQEIDERGGVSEFELPPLKRFVERTLAGSVGAAAAGAIVESYLSDIGSKMESVYDIFSTVRLELSESREALSLRLRASEIMNRTLDLSIIMDDLVRLIQKEFKLDLVVIRLLDTEGLLVTRNSSGASIPSITGRTINPDISSYIGDAFLSNRPRFLNDTRHNGKPESKMLMDHEGIISFAHIPISREGEPPIGMLSIFSRTIVGLFTQPFLELLSSLAGQLAQAIRIDSEMKAREQERQQKEEALLENARVSKEMELAKQIQMSLLPSDPPAIPGIRLAGSCIPATHVGGDYFDYFPRGESVVDMVIADVSGHSIGAALIMVETRSVLRAQVQSTDSTGTILARLNDLLHEDLSSAELFITMFYVKYDAETKVLTYSSAGHNHPLLYRPGSPCVELDAEGLILGVNRNVAFEEKKLQLQPGDTLLLYTDGVTEAQNPAGELFGEKRLCGILEKYRNEQPEELIGKIFEEVTLFADSQPLQDDVSMVAMKIL